MFAVLDDLFCADPAQPLTTAGEQLDDLDHDLSVDDQSEVWNNYTQLEYTYQVYIYEFRQNPLINTADELILFFL